MLDRKNNLLGLAGRVSSPAERRATKLPVFGFESLKGEDGLALDWFTVAARVIQSESGSFRLMSAILAMIVSDRDFSKMTNEEFAGLFGGCSIRTIIRDVVFYERAGLIRTRTIWVDVNGKKVRRREISLCIPYDTDKIIV